METTLRNTYFKFLKKLIIFTLLLGAVGYVLMLFIPPIYHTPTLPYLYVFFFSSSILVHYVLLKVSIKRTTQFINYFMLLTFGKLIFYLSLLLVYILVNRADAVPFVGAFFFLYVFYTVFEVNESLSLTKKIKGMVNNKVEKD